MYGCVVVYVYICLCIHVCGCVVFVCVFYRLYVSKESLCWEKYINYVVGHHM
jgi:hypothetical protein